jgi:death-on-curing protein
VNTPLWIDEHDAIAIHEQLLVEHGGASGVRDPGLLESALARPRQHFACQEAPNLIHMAAIYTAGIVRNHPFFDGNKRTGFVVGVLFLEINGYRFVATEEDATQAVFALAAGRTTEADYAEFLRANSKRKRR